MKATKLTPIEHALERVETAAQNLIDQAEEMRKEAHGRLICGFRKDDMLLILAVLIAIIIVVGSLTWGTVLLKHMNVI